ncbi:protein translocase subunit SecF [Candidatus Dependentiae bacterium]|nr:protein translocase subunit SecF [Candidatus Dependentiae bacterium]
MQEQSLQYRFDFLKYRFVFLAISVGALVLSLAYYFFIGGFKYHIDFTGGAEMRVHFTKPVDAGSLRTAMANDGWKDVVIQSVGKTGQEFLIRVGSLEDSLENNIKASMAKNFKDNPVTVGHIEVIGAEVGKDTTWNAIKAVFLSLVILALYIAVRSEFKFGVGAAVSLIHDILIIMAYILVTQEPISLHVLASILAVIGYSLNDTIVIFSRIRENFKKLAGSGISDYNLVNLSINQTLIRTTLTSFATLLSVASILLLGGETLHGLALIMFVGIIVGTISSIFIASPSMLWAATLAKKS